MILADTSVWIDYLRGKSPYRKILRHQLEIGNVVTIGAIFAELLQGAKTQKEVDGLLAFYNALPTLDAGNAVWLDAGVAAFSEQALQRGVGLVDLAIVTAARRSGAKIWSRDKKLLGLLKQEEKFHAKK
ncbi:MAG: PIN domain-containing protein [Spirochaetes bacterium]|nr:PIN domain-containing protein [Spirochaetota bacterium]